MYVSVCVVQVVVSGGNSYDLYDLSPLMEYSVAIYTVYDEDQSEPLTDRFTTSKKLLLLNCEDTL